MIEDHERQVASAQLRIQDLQISVEVLDDWHLARDDRIYKLSCFVCGNAMEKAYKLGQYPVKNTNYKRSVLNVRVDSVSQVGSIALVPYVVYDAESPWNVQPD